MIDKIINIWVKIVRTMTFLALSVWCIIFWYWIIKYLIIK